jgi:hypothetical protein
MSAKCPRQSAEVRGTLVQPAPVHRSQAPCRQTGVVGVPRRRKLRMLREGDIPDDLVLVIRASPATRQECIADIVADALRSGRIYAVADSRGRRQVLFGISVFARRPGVALVQVLARFDAAPAYLEAVVGSLRDAGFDVLPTGVNPDHYDVQLVPGQGEETWSHSPPSGRQRSGSWRLRGVSGRTRRTLEYPANRRRSRHDAS